MEDRNSNRQNLNQEELIMKKQLLFLVMVMLPLVASAYDVEINGIYYHLDKTVRHALVTSSPSGYTGNISIPVSVIYNDVTYYVEGIGGGSFKGCTGLTSVEIPFGVTSIGHDAFSGCSGLTSVTIGRSVLSIEDDAFSGCSGLESVTINSNAVVSASSCNIRQIFGTQVKEYIIGDDVKSIGDYAFYGCSGLTSVTIPNNVTSIGDGAFLGCSSLASVTINSNAVVSKTYSDSSSLKRIFGTQVKEYIIGDEVQSIGMYAFYDCSGLTSVTIGNSVKGIGRSAFSGCSGLTSVTINSNAVVSKTDSDSSPLKQIFGTQVKEYIIGDDVQSIGWYVFLDCSGLTSVKIPNSVTSIEYGAFYGCSGLTSVTIPNSVTSIDDYVFNRCSGLTSVTIGNSVTSIGKWAFYGCIGLQKIIVKDLAAWCRVSIADVIENAHHFYLDDNTEITDLVIPDGVTNIGNNVFSGCSSLSSVIISNSVTNIGSGAFFNCSGEASSRYFCKRIIISCG